MIHFFNILFFHNRKVGIGSFHNDISYAPVVDEDSLEALGLLSDHVPHHHQPIQTQHYYIALLERSPLPTVEDDITKATKYVRMKRGDLDD